MARLQRWAGLAPAKVNLGLAVGARRADGFHAVRTRLLALSLADRVGLIAREEPGVALELDGPFAAGLPTGPDNLAVRAATAAAEALRGKAPAGVSIHLEKHVPSEAGLAGGSSDAAAVLFGMFALAGATGGAGLALELAARLGSDVAFFLAARETGFGLATGRGELVEALSPAPEAWVALLTPSVGAPTGEVYGALEPRADLPVESGGPFDPFRDGALANDLERPALAVVPALAELRAALDAEGLAHWRLSGSGSTFFGLAAEAGTAARELSAARRAASRAGLGVRLARAVSSSPAGIRELHRWPPPAGDR